MEGERTTVISYAYVRRKLDRDGRKDEIGG
jgi:hypothetical protein